jgi:hypothetical protein
MTVVQGGLIAAADFNTMQSTLANVIGTGSGSSGWGQAVSSAQHTIGNVIRAADWNALYHDINLCWQQIYGVSVPAGTCPTLATGQLIRASDITLYSNAISTINSNRMTIATGNWTATNSAYTNTRATTWGNNTSGPETINAVFNVVWGSEDQARFFFNTGGAVNFVLSHPNTSTTQDQNWNTMLTNVGTIGLHGSTSFWNGTIGTMNQSLGYYGLTTSAQTWFTGTHIGTGAYVNNDCSITITKITNGFQVSISLTDEHANSFYDVVQSGTNVTASYNKATAIMTGIVSPSFSTVTNF